MTKPNSVYNPERYAAHFAAWEMMDAGLRDNEIVEKVGIALSTVTWLRKERNAIMRDYLAVHHMPELHICKFVRRYLEGEHLESLECEFLLSRRQTNYLLAHFTDAESREGRRAIIRRKAEREYDNNRRKNKSNIDPQWPDHTHFDDADIPPARCSVICPASTASYSSSTLAEIVE